MMEEKIKARITTDIPWAKDKLIGVVVNVLQNTGQWDRSWVVLLWRTVFFT